MALDITLPTIHGDDGQWGDKLNLALVTLAAAIGDTTGAKGDPGPQGPAGPAGANGAPGTPGVIVLNAGDPPPSNPTPGVLYVRKTA